MTINGYEMQTTFWQDFSIADKFGINAIEDTYERAFKEWKDNYIYLTELVIVVNWKCWQHYENKNEEVSRLYEKLYYKSRNYALDTLKDEELTYYLDTTD